MKETCPICQTECEEDATTCSVCKFTDKLGINRTWITKEDAKNWLETVVIPYRDKWEAEKQKKELQRQLEEANKQKAALQAELEAAKKSAQSQRPAAPPQYIPQTFSQTQPRPSIASTPRRVWNSDSILGLLGIIAVIAFFIFIFWESKDKKHFKEGNAHYDKKDYDKAIEEYTIAIKLMPNSPLYLSNRGVAYHNKKNYDKAILDFEAALRIDSNYELARQELKNTQQAQVKLKQDSLNRIYGTFTDSRDGKIYKTVKIGDQTWMAENLNYDASGSKCSDNKPENCNKYGRLYSWQTAKKVCPDGWHLPTKDEWQALDNFVGGNKVAGKKLKAKSGWNNNGNGTDEYGFSALPGGYGRYDGSFKYGSFKYVGDYGFWWSASEFSSDFAYSRGIIYNDEDARWDYSLKSFLSSVRCLPDY